MDHFLSQDRENELCEEYIRLVDSLLISDDIV